MEHTDLDELVVKCTLFDPSNITDSEIEDVYDSIFYETGLLKLNKGQSLVEIKEELIEYNSEKNVIVSYAVVVGQAQHSLADLFKIWGDKQKSHQKREFYTQEKLAFYCYQAMLCIHELHLKDIYYGDMKA